MYCFMFRSEIEDPSNWQIRFGNTNRKVNNLKVNPC